MTDKLNLLYNYLKDLGSVCIGLSGGVDSTFLCLAAKVALGDKVMAVTARSSFMIPEEIEYTKMLAERIGLDHQYVDVLADDKILSNPKDRCYYCKKRVFSEIIKTAKDNVYKNVCDGANIDDNNDYRPGTRAAEELGVISPLKECGFRKAEIREGLKFLISENENLAEYDISDKPASACLASRIPYGVTITEEILNRIQKSESYLRSMGLKQIRVRYHGDVARIEVPRECFETIIEHRNEITDAIKESGFLYVTLDLQGIRTGSMNEVLQQEEK